MSNPKTIPGSKFLSGGDFLKGILSAKGLSILQVRGPVLCREFSGV